MTKLDLSALGHSFSDDEFEKLMMGIVEAIGERSKAATSTAATLAYLDAIILIMKGLADLATSRGEDSSEMDAYVRNFQDAFEALKKLDMSGGAA